MSRISWEGQLPDGRPVLVVGGWDKPVGGYHFGVYLRGGKGSKSDVIYDNVEDARLQPYMGFPPMLGAFKVVAAKLGLAPPQKFWERCAERLGNEIEHIE